MFRIFFVCLISFQLSAQVTNKNGWDGDRAENGVYVYRIILLDQILLGNITLIR